MPLIERAFSCPGNEHAISRIATSGSEAVLHPGSSIIRAGPENGIRSQGNMNKLLLSTAFACLLMGFATAQQDPANKDQAAGKSTAAPTTKTFTDYQMGMAFDYPSTWTLVTDPEPKKKKALVDLGSILGKKRKAVPAAGKQSTQETLFYVPTSGHAADLEIYSALWDQTPELWESVQADAAKNLNRKVVKQWREEILGVPLLLTQLSYDDAGGPVYTLSGLVYSRTPYKMQFVLTANMEDFESADYEVRQALQTLRTTSGALPVAEDPNHPLDKTAYVNVNNKAPQVLVMSLPPADPTKAKKGSVVVNATAAGQKVLLTMPAGWSVDGPAADGTITLHNAAITGTITVTVASVVDSDPAQSAILKATAQSLDLFDKVTQRDEVTNKFSTAGAETDTIWRNGQTASGPMTTCEAYGSTGDNYWLLRYQLKGTTSAEERKAIEALVDGMSVDPAQ